MFNFSESVVLFLFAFSPCRINCKLSAFSFVSFFRVFKCTVGAIRSHYDYYLLWFSLLLLTVWNAVVPLFLVLTSFFFCQLILISLYIYINNFCSFVFVFHFRCVLTEDARTDKVPKKKCTQQCMFGCVTLKTRRELCSGISLFTHVFLIVATSPLFLSLFFSKKKKSDIHHVDQTRTIRFVFFFKVCFSQILKSRVHHFK